MGEPAQLERSVAFFGAVDSRPQLFMLTVALESIRRHHPLSGFYALLPEAGIAEVAGGARALTGWGSLLREWSAGHIQPLALPAAAQRDEFAAVSPQQPGHGNSSADGVVTYSRMTFHRHRVPEALAERGFRFSINVDPDVLCVRPWDLRLLMGVGLIAGRPVGSTSRTARWLQGMHGRPPDAKGNASSVWSSLQRELGVTRDQLLQTEELNGGVLVFNNTEARRVRWGFTMARYYARLAHLVEGDQDLIGLVLAANPSLHRSALPTVYNYAFRRDRERLPYAVSHRLRHGLFGQQVVNVHFVADGKPWQRQDLASYPLWLLAARLHYVREWLRVARSLRPRPFGDSARRVRLTSTERRAFGPAALDALRAAPRSSANGTLATLADDQVRRRCRCFMRSLARDKKAEPLHLLTLEAGKRSRAVQTTQASTVAGSGGPVRMGAAWMPPAHARSLVQRQRAALLAACGGRQDGDAPTDERQQCEAELAAASAYFNCALNLHKAGRSDSRRGATTCAVAAAGARASATAASLAAEATAKETQARRRPHLE